MENIIKNLKMIIIRLIPAYSAGCSGMAGSQRGEDTAVLRRDCNYSEHFGQSAEHLY